jgi:O-antigen ligase
MIAVVFAFNIILFTGSRTGYLATLALSSFFWLRSTRKGRFVAVILLVAAAGIPAIPPQYESRFMSAFVGEAAEGHSKEARIELANDAWDLFLANPQGLGIYAFRYAREDQLGKEQYDPHNLYLQMLVDIGVPGTFLFVLLIWAVWRELRSTEMALVDSENQLMAVMRQDPNPDARLKAHLADVRFMRGTASAFLAFIFTRVILGVFGHDLYEIYWWLSSGASIAIVNMKPVADARTAAIVAASAFGKAAGTAVPARNL